MLDECDVGHRVVVRRYAGTGPHGRMLFSDLLGLLVALDGERLVVRTRDGVDHAVPVTEVATGKRIPPAPVKRSEIIELERIADAAWPAPVHERLGEWILRAADGWTGRANSALPLGDPGLPLDEAIDVVQHWYGRRGLRPAMNVPLPARRDVDAALTARGWSGLGSVLVQVAPLADLLAAAEARSRPAGPAPHTDLAGAPSEDFLAVVAARKRSLPRAARHVLTAVTPVRFAEVRGDDGALLAIARGAVVGEWLHLGLVEVAESARRHGLGGQVSIALARWAAGAGAASAMLQVDETNQAAIALYSRLGFTTHHRYATRLAG